MSFKAIKRIGIELINVSLRFVRLTVVVVKKQYLLNILTEVFVGFVKQHTRIMRVLCFHLWLVSLCSFFHIILNRQYLRNN